MIVEGLIFVAALKAGKALLDEGMAADAEKIRAEQGLSSRPVSEVPLSEEEKRNNYWKNMKAGYRTWL